MQLLAERSSVWIFSAVASIAAAYLVTERSSAALVLAVAIAGAWIWRRPRAQFVLIVGLLVSVPYYALPNFGGQPLVPAAIASWVLALSLLFRGERWRGPITGVDVATCALGAAMIVTVALGARSRGDLFREVVLWLGPFVGARLFVTTRTKLDFALKTLVASGLALVPFAAVERWAGLNPFHGLADNTAASSVWLSEAARLSATRAETSFGHPIALSMFFAGAAVIALALALESSASHARRVWASACVILLFGNALTASRSGWVVVAVGFALLAPARGGWARRPAFVVIALVLVVGVSIVPAARPVRAVVSSIFVDRGSTEISTSAQYRHDLLREARRPNTFRWFGNPQPHFAGSVDNEYIFLADRWGLVAAVALLAVGVAAAFGAVRRSPTAVERASLAAAVGLFVALVAVAFITQQQVFVWIVAGLGSGALSLRARTGTAVS